MTSNDATTDQTIMTSDNIVWPPSPAIPDPLTEHDEFLTALVGRPAAQPPLSRMSAAATVVSFVVAANLTRREADEARQRMSE